ncbi:MAG TPA: PAS domain-containing protein, partial [Actinomycetota bacterium]|nr:PAS domain-containing protein [Actinomycetota bacterium]
MRSEEIDPVRSHPAGSAYAMWVGFACAAFGALTIVGWYARAHELEAFGPWTVVLAPMSAVGIVLVGIALATRALARAPRASQVFGGMVAAFGFVGFIDHYRPSARIGYRFAVDLLRIRPSADLRPMAPAAAVSLIVLGVAIIATWRAPVPRAASVCAFIASVPPAVIVVAYVYDLHLSSDVARMSFPAAVCLLGVASAVWWLRGDDSALRILRASGPGGSMARRLVPVGIVVPIILGWPRVVAMRDHIFGSTISVALGQVEVATLFATAVFWAAVSIDRMERRRREAAALSEHRGVQLAKAQRIAQVGSWERDLRTGRSEWSAEMQRLLGYEAGAVTPDFGAFLDRVSPQDRARVVDALERGIATATSFSIEFTIRLPDGTARRLESQGDIETENGTPIRVVGVARDVTEQRRVEDALRESE